VPDSFAQHADGLLLAANGIDPVLRWDGLSADAEAAGVAAPASAPSLSASGAGSVTGSYSAYVRFVDRLGNVSNLSPVSAELTASSASTVTYSSVPTPQEPKVARRQLLRNTAGQARTFYVDVDTDDLTGGTFSSTRADAELSAQEGVALLDEESRPLANRHGVPPDDRAVLAAHLDRVFLAGEEVYDRGCVALTAGGASVSGFGTEWPANLAGRFLWADGADRAYEIASVDAASQTLTLAEGYGGATDPYAAYAIRPALPRRRLVQFSEAGLPESWPAANAVSVQEDSDEITALMPMGSFLYILGRRHCYRLTFQQSPLDDGFVFYVGGRGCVNNRCWAVVDESAYLLDEAGVYAFQGGREAEDVSAPIQDLFETGAARGRPYRIQWAASRWFHCVYDPGEKVVRWFVTLSGQGVPRHAICYDLARRAWWVEEFPFPVGASCAFRLAGEPRVALGGPGGQVCVMSQGSLDLADAEAGTVRGTATASGPRSLTDSSASFAAGLAGATVRIVSGEGKGQARRVRGNDSVTLEVDVPWARRPDATSGYQVGGVQWKYRTGWFRFAPSEEDAPRRLEVIFEPVSSPCTMDARVYYDRSRDPVGWGFSYTSEEAMGFASTDGEADLVADLTKPIGLVQRRLDWRKEFYIDGPRLVQVELAGVAGAGPVTLYGVQIDGAVP
jgi:hypothetical protein